MTTEQGTVDDPMIPHEAAESSENRLDNATMQFAHRLMVIAGEGQDSPTWADTQEFYETGDLGRLAKKAFNRLISEPDADRPDRLHLRAPINIIRLKAVNPQMHMPANPDLAASIYHRATTPTKEYGLGGDLLELYSDNGKYELGESDWQFAAAAMLANKRFNLVEELLDPSRFDANAAAVNPETGELLLNSSIAPLVESVLNLPEDNRMREALIETVLDADEGHTDDGQPRQTYPRLRQLIESKAEPIEHNPVQYDLDTAEPETAAFMAKLWSEMMADPGAAELGIGVPENPVVGVDVSGLPLQLRVMAEFVDAADFPCDITELDPGLARVVVLAMCHQTVNIANNNMREYNWVPYGTRDGQIPAPYSALIQEYLVDHGVPEEQIPDRMEEVAPFVVSAMAATGRIDLLQTACTVPRMLSGNFDNGRSETFNEQRRSAVAQEISGWLRTMNETLTTYNAVAGQPLPREVSALAENLDRINQTVLVPRILKN